jgi:hypothetical protein
MTTISTNSDVITLINVFTVEPANQRRLTELLVAHVIEFDGGILNHCRGQFSMEVIRSRERDCRQEIRGLFATGGPMDAVARIMTRSRSGRSSVR